MSSAAVRLHPPALRRVCLSWCRRHQASHFLKPLPTPRSRARFSGVATTGMVISILGQALLLTFLSNFRLPLLRRRRRTLHLIRTTLFLSTGRTRKLIGSPMTMTRSCSCALLMLPAALPCRLCVRAPDTTSIRARMSWSSPTPSRGKGREKSGSARLTTLTSHRRLGLAALMVAGQWNRVRACQQKYCTPLQHDYHIV